MRLFYFKMLFYPICTHLLTYMSTALSDTDMHHQHTILNADVKNSLYVTF